MTKCTGAPWWEEMKMLRVSKREERSRTVLIVEGHLSADYVQVIETCCNEAIINWGDRSSVSARRPDHRWCQLRTSIAAGSERCPSARYYSGVYTSHLIRELTPTTENSASPGAGRDQEVCGPSED